jgi:uncharacterized protein YndB with AHSA1/START domain
MEKAEWKKPRFWAIGAILALMPAARAEVADSSANGFTVKITQVIQAPPEEVYRRFIRNVGDWWNPEHTYSNNAHNLSIEEKAMGCFCERLPNQGGVRHMQVLYLDPGKIVVLTGALGPLQSLAATGTMTVQFSPAAGGTKFDVNYAVAGYLAAGMKSWAAPVDAMLSEQFTRLKIYVEHGNPAPK